MSTIRSAVAIWEAGRDVSGAKPYGQLGAIIEVMLGTSARIGEVLAIRRRDVDVTSAPERVEAARRGDTMTIINYQSTHFSVPVRGTDALTGTAVTRVDLPPFGWAIVRTRG